MPHRSSTLADAPAFALPAPGPRRLRWQGSASEAAASLLRAGSLLLCLGILAMFTLKAPGFLSPVNVGLIVSQSAVLGILGFGLTLVLVTGGTDLIAGGIDLSLAGTLGLSAGVFAVLNRAGYGDGLAVAGALATGLLVGGINAMAILRLRILPLLATLAVMNICAGLELVLTENTTIPVVSPLIDVLGATGPLSMPVLGLVLLGLAIVLGALMRISPFGLRAYAVGGHPEAARAAGIAAPRYIAASYILSGFLGGVAGLVSVTFLNGSTPGSGDMLLPVVATAFLGVVFSRRLVPTVAGTLVAALFLGSLANGFQLLHVSTYWVNGIEGALILAVVGGTSSLAKGRRR